MIIWDTGEYEVLPFRAIEKRPETDDSASDVSDVSTNMAAIQQPSESEKLREAFQNVWQTLEPIRFTNYDWQRT